MGWRVTPLPSPFQGTLWQGPSLKKPLPRKTTPPATRLHGPVSSPPGISSPSPGSVRGAHGRGKCCRLGVRMADSRGRAGIQTTAVAMACPPMAMPPQGLQCPDKGRETGAGLHGTGLKMAAWPVGPARCLTAVTGLGGGCHSGRHKGHCD